MGEDKKTGETPKAEKGQEEKVVKKVYLQPVSTLATVIVAIVAVAGLAIGVYGLLNFQALNDKMAESNHAPAATKEADCDEDEAEKCGNEEESEEATIADEDTIYIGAWGIAISIPEGTFSKIAYSFNSAEDAVYLSAVIKDASVSEPAYFGEGSDHSLGAITRMETDKYNERVAMDGVKVADLGGYTYIFTHAQDFTSTKAADLKVETDSSEALQKVLTDSENISEF